MQKTLKTKSSFSFLFLLPLLLLLGACGGGGGSSNVALSFRLGAIVSPQVVSGGGMVYGQDTVGGGKWAQAIPAGATSFSKVMGNGTWNFQVIAWDGASPLSGTVRCASTTGISLTGSPADVSLSLATANCDATFTNSAYTADATYGIAPLRLVACSNLLNISTGSDNCNSPLEKVGMSQSYQVVMMSYQAGARIEGLSSSCISHANLVKHKRADSVFFTNVRVPIGGSNGAFDMRIKSFDDKNCSAPSFNRDYDFINGMGVPRTELGLALDNFKSIGDVDHIVKTTTTPYGSGTYSTSQSNYMALDVEYVQGSGGVGCNCSGLPADIQAACIQDTVSDGGTSGTCPSVSNSVVNFVGSGFGGGTVAKCFSDFSNNNGPNCDAGVINFYRVSCRPDGVSAANPLICELKGSDSTSCGGEGTACRFGANAPQFVSLYLADNIFASAGTPFVAQAPDFKCGGAHCVPLRIVDGSGSGITQTSSDAVRSATSDVFGTFDGESSYQTNGDSCINDSVVTVTGSGSGSYNVYWRMPFPAEVATCNSMYDHGDDHVDGGMIGNIREMLIGDGIGGFLWNLGYTTCASIPSSGSTSVFTFNEDGRARSFYTAFAPGNVAMPAFGSGSGLFEKKIALYETTPGTLQSLRWVYQFNCSANLQTGYVWGNWDGYESDGSLRTESEEAFYDTNNPALAKIEFVKANKSNGINNTYDNRLRVRAEKLNSSEYAIWQSKVDGNNYGFGSSAGSSSGSGLGGFYGNLPNESLGNLPDMGSGPGKLYWNGSNLLVRGNTTEASVKFYQSGFFGDISKQRLPFVKFDDDRLVVFTNGAVDNGLQYTLTDVDVSAATATSTGSGFQTNYNGSGTGGGYVNPTMMSPVLVDAINAGLGGLGVFASTKYNLSPIVTSGTRYFLNGAPAYSILPGNITSTLQEFTTAACIPFGTGVSISINGSAVSVFETIGCTAKVATPFGLSIATMPITANSRSIASVNTSAAIASSCLKYDGAAGTCTVVAPGDINLVNSPIDPNVFSVDWLLDPVNLP